MQIAGHSIGELLKQAKYHWKLQEPVELKRFEYAGAELKKLYRKQPLQIMHVQHVLIPSSNINIVNFYGRRKVVLGDKISVEPSVLQVDFQITAFLFPNRKVQWYWLGARAAAPAHAESYHNTFLPTVIIEIENKDYVLVNRTKGGSVKGINWISIYEIKDSKLVHRVKYSK